MELSYSPFKGLNIPGDLSSDPSIANNSYTLFGNPNIEFVAGKAKSLGVDKVFLMKIETTTSGQSVGTYKMWVYDANAQVLYADEGTWPFNNQSVPTIGRAVFNILRKSETAKVGG